MVLLINNDASTKRCEMRRSPVLLERANTSNAIAIYGERKMDPKVQRQMTGFCVFIHDAKKTDISNLWPAS